MAMRWLKRVVIAGSFLFVFLTLATNVWIVQSTSQRVFSNADALPDHRVALVLGTSNKTATGNSNPYFERRIATAAELFKLGKIDHVIVSGDNRSRYYNEPMEMQKALMKHGVPQAAITLDFAGLRTLDSVVRCKEIFGQSRITIITQPFHSYRALFISSFYDIEAVAMVTNEPDADYTARVRVREYLARTKAVLDLYVLRTTPRFMGEKELIKVIPGR